MIINQDFNVLNRDNRPVRGNKSVGGEPGKGGADTQPVSFKETADTVILDAQRLTVKENLQASEATVTTQASAGNLIDLLKTQFGNNPAQAMNAQLDKLNASAAKLLSEVEQ